jgi:hypothetical protein
MNLRDVGSETSDNNSVQTNKMINKRYFTLMKPVGQAKYPST